MRILLLSMLFTPLCFANADDKLKITEVLREAQKTYLIEYQNGQTETFISTYQGYYTAHVWQTGKSSKPLEGHPLDTRECSWTTGSWVGRTGHIISLSGAKAELNRWGEVYYTSETKNDESKGLVREFFSDNSCSAVAEIWEKNIKDERALVKAHFDDIVAEAQEDEPAQLAERIPNAVSITEITTEKSQ